MTTLFAFDGVSCVLLRLVSSPCSPCPPDAYATLARVRLWKSPSDSHPLHTNQTHTKTTTGKSHFDYYCGFVYNYNYDLSYTFQFKLYFFETCVKIFILTWCSDNVLWKRRPTRANRYFATLSTYSEETVLVVGTSACNTAEEVSNTVGPRIQNLRVGPPTLRLCRIISDRETLPPAVPQQKFRRGVCFAATPQTRC